MPDIPQLCSHVLFRATYYQPAEYCEAEVEDGFDYCYVHLDDDEPDPDDIRMWREERGLEYEGDYE